MALQSGATNEDRSFKHTVRAREGRSDRLREEGRIVHYLAPEELTSLLDNVHPACASFALAAEDTASMVDSFLQSGPRHPIETLNGQLLDGRRRTRAALRLKWQLPAIHLCVEDLQGKTPFEYALEANRAAGCGRQLTPIQVAMAAMRYQQHTLAEERAAARRRQQQGVAAGADVKGEAVERAAVRFGVSVHTLRIAVELFRTNDERLCELAESHRLSLAAVRTIIKLPAPARREAIASELARREFTRRARALNVPRSSAEVAEDLCRESQSLHLYVDRAEKILATNSDLAFDMAPIRTALRQFDGFIERLAKRFPTP